jgi:signal transduction histidine kinase
MIRFPIFYITIGLFFISCSESQKKKTIINSTISNALIKNMELGDVNLKKKQFDSAFYYYNKLKELSHKQNDTSYISYSLVQIAAIQHNFSDYSGVENTCVEALPFIQKDTKYAEAIYNLLGISAKEMCNYKEALTYYQKAKMITENQLSRLILENNIAGVYMKNNDYHTAIKILNQSLKSNNVDILDTTKTYKALVLDNLGFSYFKINQFQKGLDLMNQALAIRTNMGDVYASIESYLHLAEYYQDNNIQASLQNASKAYKAASQYQSIDERLESLKFLMSYNQEKGDNKYAIKYASLNNNAKNQFAKIKYDFKQENEKNLELEAKNATAELQIQKQKNQKTIFIFGMVLLIGFIAYITKYFINKNKRERIQATYNTETRISKKLHDELANDVFQTMTFAETQNLENPIKKDLLIDNLEKIYKKARDISRENNDVDTAEKYEEKLKQMISSYGNDLIKVMIKTDQPIDWKLISSEKKIVVYRVVQELLVNMKKHSQSSHVVIGFDDFAKQVALTYSDNGIGIKKNADLKNGLDNVENRIHSINGTITFDTQTSKGFKVKIQFPK